MLRNLSKVAAWALFAFIVYATFSPVADRPTVSHSTGFEHVAAFTALGLLFFLGYPGRLMAVCALVLGGAVLLEIAQNFAPDRHGRILDAAQKFVGGGLGIFAGQIVHYLIGRLNARFNS